MSVASSRLLPDLLERGTYRRSTPKKVVISRDSRNLCNCFREKHTLLDETQPDLSMQLLRAPGNQQMWITLRGSACTHDVRAWVSTMTVLVLFCNHQIRGELFITCEIITLKTTIGISYAYSLKGDISKFDFKFLPEMSCYEKWHLIYTYYCRCG